MNKKLALLICLLAVFGLRIQAQMDHFAVGFYIGGNVHNMGIGQEFYYDDDNPIPIKDESLNVVDYTYLKINDASVSASFGPNIGGFFEFRLNDYFGVQFDLMFNRTGYYISGNVDQANITDTTNLKYKATVKAANLNIGATAKLHLFDDHMSVDLGIVPNYCFKLSKDIERGIQKSSISYKNEEYNAFGCGVLFGISGYIGEVFYIGLHYNLGFTNVLKTKTPYLDEASQQVAYKYENAPSKSSSLQLTVGMRLKN